MVSLSPSAFLRDGDVRLVSNSELDTFKRCRRKWWLGTYRGLQLAAGDSIVGALVVGNRVHAGLAAWYEPSYGADQFNDELALHVYDELVRADKAELGTYVDGEIGEELPRTPPSGFESDVELGRLMLGGYFEWVRETGIDEDWRVLTAETRQRASLREGVDLVAKYDLEVERLSDGARRFVDHKTVGNLTDIPRVAHIASQFKHYALVQRLRFGGDVRTDGGIYNMLRKVKRTIRAKPPFFGRHEVHHNDNDLRSYWMQVTGHVGRLLQAEEQLADGGSHQFIVPPTPAQDCSWSCPFFAVCPMFDDGSDAEGFLEDWYHVGDPLARYRDTVNEDGQTIDEEIA
jgi:hypothetical protein